MWDQNPNNAQRTTQGSHITHLTKKEKPNTQDINWKWKSIFIEWRINQIKLHTTFSLNTKPTLVMPKKKKKNQSHSQFQTHPFAQKKKRKKELSKKSKTIKQNPDEKIKESTYIQKPQMRIHLIWFYSSLSQSQNPARREREREKESSEKAISSWNDWSVWFWGREKYYIFIFF